MSTQPLIGEKSSDLPSVQKLLNKNEDWCGMHVRNKWLQKRVIVFRKKTIFVIWDENEIPLRSTFTRRVVITVGHYSFSLRRVFLFFTTPKHMLNSVAITRTLLYQISSMGPRSNARELDSWTVVQPCIWFKEEPSKFSLGQTAQSLTCSIMEKPHTGLDECQRILLSCFRARNSGERELHIHNLQWLAD